MVFALAQHDVESLRERESFSAVLISPQEVQNFSAIFHRTYITAVFESTTSQTYMYVFLYDTKNLYNIYSKKYLANYTKSHCVCTKNSSCMF